ncbi:hypothetical protein SRABI133_03147 [Peribacillus simplex]|uniref:Uncharacterized protein n=1 Tax=Peribacillus simplex TaxID=1478 RepID=A0A9W4PEP0_9BACI|nr:hypothetical protein SRABI133_03147 [Peribacillus simplex]
MRKTDEKMGVTPPHFNTIQQIASSQTIYTIDNLMILFDLLDKKIVIVPK